MGRETSLLADKRITRRDPFPFLHTYQCAHDHADDLDWQTMNFKDFEPVLEKHFTRSSLLNINEGSSQLGFGTYGVVRKYRHKKSGLIFAIKSMRKKNVLESDMLDQVTMEVATQMQLNHPNIVKCYAMLNEEAEIHVVLEYCSRGNLYGLLRRNPSRRFPEEQSFYYFMQLINALYFVHTKGFFHRDLKLENALVTDGDIVKLCDFGWCANVISENANRNFCGTLDYLAPEMIQGGGHDWRVDLWGMGVLLYEMLEGKPPFVATRHVDLVSNILKRQLQFPKWFSDTAVKSIEALLQIEAEKRVPFNKLLAHVPDLELMFVRLSVAFENRENQNEKQ